MTLLKDIMPAVDGGNAGQVAAVARALDAIAAWLPDVAAYEWGPDGGGGGGAGCTVRVRFTGAAGSPGGAAGGGDAPPPPGLPSATFLRCARMVLEYLGPRMPEARDGAKLGSGGRRTLWPASAALLGPYLRLWARTAHAALA